MLVCFNTNPIVPVIITAAAGCIAQKPIESRGSQVFTTKTKPVTIIMVIKSLQKKTLSTKMVAKVIAE